MKCNFTVVFFLFISKINRFRNLKKDNNIGKGWEKEIEFVQLYFVL